jgi:hypothetical protein
VSVLLSGRYRLSRREVRQILQDLWAVRVSLGAVVLREQAQSAALAPVVEEAQAAVQAGHDLQRDPLVQGLKRPAVPSSASMSMWAMVGGAIMSAEVLKSTRLILRPPGWKSPASAP